MSHKKIFLCWKNVETSTRINFSELQFVFRFWEMITTSCIRKLWLISYLLFNWWTLIVRTMFNLLSLIIILLSIGISTINSIILHEQNVMKERNFGKIIKISTHVTSNKLDSNKSFRKLKKLLKLWIILLKNSLLCFHKLCFFLAFQVFCFL